MNRQRAAAAEAATKAEPQPTITTGESAKKTEPQPARKFIEHVKINYDDVIRHGRQQDRRFLFLYWDMQDSFGDRNYGFRVCLHEAAHGELMEEDGIKNVRFHMPSIHYDPAKDDFFAFGAMVQGDDLPDGQQATQELIFAVTTHMTAGGVALRMVGADESGDDDDYQKFLLRCADAPPGLIKEKPEELWKRAQEAARVRLSKPETKSKVEARTQEYLARLYSR